MPGVLIRDVEYRGEVTDLLVSTTQVNRLRDYDHVIDGTGLVAVPAFDDGHVHFREPGFTDKEDLLTGARAAAAGGYARVVCEPNTRPVIDDAEALRAHWRRVRELGLPITVETKCALTLGQAGEALVNIPEIAAGVPFGVEFSSDGEPVADHDLLVRAFRLCDGPTRIHLHCEETPRSRERVAAFLGPGTPMAREAELIALALEARADAGTGRLHIQHVSLAESARLIADAKRKGFPVTAEVAPHHLLLCDEMIPTRDGGPDANWKMNPPLRSAADMFAMRRALAEGVIDVIATDHAPHTPAEKARAWDDAPFGVLGLETAFGACMGLVLTGDLTFDRLIAAMTGDAAAYSRAFGFEAAQLTLVDPKAVWTVDPDRFYSKSRNCPFAGMTFTGKPVYTIANGQVVMAEGEVLF
jgi:dihydroorotase